MHKSQLRKLARRFAGGGIDREAYRRQRRELIDGYVSGRVAIEREAPPAPPPPPEVVHVPPDPPNRMPLWIGAGAVVIVALVAWALIPGDEPPAAPAPEAATDPVPLRQVPKARTLVETFLAEKDWSAGSIADFKAEWGALASGERVEAREAPWFRRLSKALRQEINTQKALAEIDDSGAAVKAGERLFEFGEFLGIGDTLPDFPQSRATGGAVPAAAAVRPPQAAAIASAAPATAAPAADEPSGRAWLAAQPARSITVQLFALDHLDRVERLLANHPEAGLRVVEFPGAAPRYRVLFGAYPSEGAAREAFAGLPAAVRAEQPSPIYKPIAELRGAKPAAARPVAATGGSWIAAQDPARFTLQLFASDSRENVDRLVASYPALGLHVHHLAADHASRYRVLFGSYASAEEALAASRGLPDAVLADTGAPLVKSVAELQRPTGD